MPRHNTLEICRIHLFDDTDTLNKKNIPPTVQQRILRIRAAYTLWNDFPQKKDAEIRDHIIRISGISRTEAYEDIHILKSLLGNMAASSKDFHRFRFNAMIQEAFRMAELKKDTRSMVAAADKYARYNQLHKDDELRIPWEEIIIQPFEPTSDPQNIGIKPVPNIRQKIDQMKKKYIREIAEDITFEQPDIDEETVFNFPTAVSEINNQT
jgi:hypothetical protein